MPGLMYGKKEMLSLLVKKYKLYLYAAGAALVIAGWLGSLWFAYGAGKDKILADQAELLKEKDRRIIKLQMELEDEQQKIKVVYRDRIKTIRTAPYPSGCSDAPVAPDILQQLKH